MASKSVGRKKAEATAKDHTTALRRGDTVMIISGGNKETKPLKGKVGKILRFVGSERVVVEGLNMVTRHTRAAGPDKPSGKIQKEAPVHISNVMYYVEKLKRPVRLKAKFVETATKGKMRKVRGFMNPQTKSFEEIAAK